MSAVYFTCKSNLNEIINFNYLHLSVTATPGLIGYWHWKGNNARRIVSTGTLSLSCSVLLEAIWTNSQSARLHQRCEIRGKAWRWVQTPRWDSDATVATVIRPLTSVISSLSLTRLFSPSQTFAWFNDLTTPADGGQMGCQWISAPPEPKSLLSKPEK